MWHRCGIDVDGEICTKGRHRFLGYFYDKQLTEEVIYNEGFISTGDIGYFDKNGYLYIVDEMKDGNKLYRLRLAIRNRSCSV